MVTDERIELWVLFCCAGGFCAYSWYWFIRSIIFYRGNGFDFSEDFGPKVYWSARGGDDRLLAKPKAKFMFIMPFFVVATSVMLLLAVLALTGLIEHCVGCRP
ncbi:hypothetical protein ACU8MP_04265 [Rhizobium leguminosarum]|uniref:hypothetical protein n=1 Tax=Rhizobium leguminosarum TaxID=384 RepID=UPI00103991CC|nr:hypothetical protein [Rhizobium leguminosarum]MBB4522997.1 hypothetical protein [Rhizobium leguminosarum]MDH6659167.1 hypothetical protein [Rhizobium sophorae]TBY31292.1 hypothetical protein E0H60_30240 [Rhizobium leguminosarum bv. viciae]